MRILARGEEFLNKMKWSNFLSSWEWRCVYWKWEGVGNGGLEGIYNLFNNSGRTCSIIEMWKRGCCVVSMVFGKFSFRMREKNIYDTF